MTKPNEPDYRELVKILWSNMGPKAKRATLEELQDEPELLQALDETVEI